MRNDSRTSSPSRFSRRQAAGKLGLAASAAIIVMLAASEARDILPGMHEDGLTQSLRQSAWTKALADQTATEFWPPKTRSATSWVTFATRAKVPTKFATTGRT